MFRLLRLLFVIAAATGLHHPSTKGTSSYRVQGLCESRGGRPGLSVLTSLMVSVDVKLTHWSQLVPNMSTDIRGH